MGQQQLLLLVLGIVIVGLAVVVGIQAFDDNLVKAQADALTVEAARFASDLQAYAIKPTAFGGGGGSFANADFDAIGYPTGNTTLSSCTDARDAGDGDYETANGVWVVTSQAAGQVVITGTGCASDGTAQHSVVTTIDGTTSADISTVVN